MIRQCFASIVCVLSAFAIAGADERSERDLAKQLDPAFALVEQAVAEGKVPGAIALIARNGELVRQEAFGLCDIENERPMRTDTICWLASITKPVTAAAAMKLVEEGKLSLDDLVEKHLPEFKQQTAADGKHYAVTIRQLMCHASGMQASPPTRPRDFFSAEWLSRELREIPPLIAETKLEFEPGSRVQYSNAAPYVLGRIIELRSGRPFHEYVRATILDPLEMDDSHFVLPASAAERLAVVYRRRDGRQDTFFRFDPAWRMRMTMPDGGLFGTAEDTARFVQALLHQDGKVLSQESMKAMLAEQAPGWGLGWALEDDGSFHHTGSAGTLAWGDPQTGTVGVLFCQIQDDRTVQPLRDQFRRAVAAAIFRR